MKRGWWIAKFVLLAVVLIVVVGFTIMSLWNWLVPELFHGPVITFWQGLGLLLLSKILFHSFGGKTNSNHNGGPWKYYWKKKLGGMDPEEKERFKQKMKEKWCSWDNDKSPS